MFPLIMAALSMAKQNAQNQQDTINQLNSNRVMYNGQPQQQKMMQQPSGGLGNALSTISSVYGGLFGGK